MAGGLRQSRLPVEHLLRRFAGAHFGRTKKKIRIYLDSRWPADNYEATRSMRDRLIWKGYRSGSELFYLAFPEAKHNENAYAARSSIPFQFLFGNCQPSDKN